MNIIEKIGKEDSFVIILEDYYGSGWINSIKQAIKAKINPTIIKKNDLEVSLEFSEYEILFEKDNVSVKVEIDDIGPVALIVKNDITEEAKQKLRDWAIVIVEEVERLNNG